MCVEADRLPSQEERSTQGGPRGFKPLVVFAVIAVLLAGGLTTFFALRDGSGKEPTAQQNRSTKPGDVMKSFNELQNLFRHSIRSQDESILGAILTSDSKALPTARHDIRQRRKYDIRDETRFQTESEHVAALTKDQLKVTEVVDVSPKFISKKTGKDITTSQPMKQVLRWELHREGGEWRIYSVFATQSSVLNK